MRGTTTNKSGRTLLLCTLLLMAGAVSAADATLSYGVTYRGVFSLGQDMAIADVTLSERPVAKNPRVVTTRLEASSAAYPTVESLYPFRYRFRTWSDAETRQLLGLETLQKTKKKRHRVYLRKRSGSKMRRLDASGGKGRAAVVRLESGQSPLSRLPAELLLDRLGMLQQLRRQSLHKGASYRYRVTNGKDQFEYRARIERAQRLKIHGRTVATWKVRLDAVEFDDDGSTKPAHRPAYIWLDQAPGHVPMRIDSRHAIGLFRVELKPAAFTVASHASP